MLLLLSPAKSLNFDCNVQSQIATIPTFIDDSKILIDELKKLSANQLAKLMKISDKLAELNFERYQNFQFPFNLENAKQAILVFDGDVYKGIEIENYDQSDLEFAQKHLRILSGLYGILKPLDLIRAYRLEMGTNFANQKGKNLYQFWQNKITDFLNSELKEQSSKTIINLASNEYFSSIDTDKITGKIINIVFKEQKGENYKTIGLLAKRARGLMVNYIIKNKINDPKKIKDFTIGNYKFRSEFSDENNWHFYR